MEYELGAVCRFAFNRNRLEQAQKAAKRAFDLRERTSEYEKLKIISDYHTIVTGDVEKSIGALQAIMVIYPRNFLVLNDLGARHNDTGRYERAIEEFREAIQLNRNSAPSYLGLAWALKCLNRFDEARQVYKEAMARGLDIPSYHADLYKIAFVQGRCSGDATRTRFDASPTQRGLYAHVAR